MKTANKNKITYLEGSAIFLTMLIANLIAQLFCSILNFFLAGKMSETNLNVLFSLIIVLFYAIAIILRYTIREKKVPVSYATYFCAPKPLSAVVSIFVPLITVAGFYLLAGWFSVFLDYIGCNLTTELNFTTAGEWIFGAIVMVIVAPIGEEFVFRGALLSGLRTVYSETASMFICALAFSLMHMNPEQTVYQFFLGLVASYSAIKTRNLWTSVIIHSVSNAVALSFYAPSVYTVVDSVVATLTNGVFLSIISTVLLAVVAVVVIYFAYKLPKITTTVVADLYEPTLKDGRQSFSQADENCSKSGTVSQSVDTCDDNQSVAQANAIKDTQLKDEDQGETDIDESNCKSVNSPPSKIVLISAFALCGIMWLAVFISGFLV